jgi:outer membrane protein assembly factor BamB
VRSLSVSAVALCSAVALALVLTAANACAIEAWQQFRGPDGQGHSHSTGLPTQWSESTGIVWKSALPGLGHSSPVFVDRQLWMTAGVNEGKSLRVLCVDAETGMLLNDLEIFTPSDPPHINAKNSYASPTAAIEPGRVYVHFGTVGTACIDTATAKPVWTNTEIHWDHQEGPGSSPILYENLLIFHADGRDSQSIVALDKQTGKIVWNTKRSGPISETPDFRKAFCTPLVIHVAGKPQLVSPCADRVIGYDPASGAELWNVDYKGFSNVPRPVFGGGLLYVCTGYMRPQLWAINPSGEGDITQSAVAWKVDKQAPANPSPLLLERELYMVSDQGVLTCLDAGNGEVVWRERLGGNFSASPIAGDGKLYFASEDGVTSVVAPGKEFKLLAANKLDGRIMASPVVYGRHLLLRTGTHLYKVGQPEVEKTVAADGK